MNGRAPAVSWLVGGLVVAALAAVYVGSPRRALFDSRFALLTSEALLTRGSWDLAPLLHDELLDDVRGRRQEKYFLRHLWQLEPMADGRVIYRYPPGTPLFSLPFVAVARQFGASTIAADGRYSRNRELRLQTLLAALVAAATALAVHRLALRELPLAPATAVALVAGLGGQLWSTASRSLWPHTWTTVWIAFALLELLRWEDGERRRPVLLALLVSAAFWSRPTAALAAAPIALLVALRHRVALPRLLVTGALALAAYGLLTQLIWSSPLPAYTRVLEHGAARHSRLVPLLFSIRGGLLVYSPILAAIALTLVVRGVALERRPFAALNLGIVAAHLALYSYWRFDVGGTMGLRFLTELTPCFAWLGAHAWRRAREAASERPPAPLRRLAVRSAVVLLAAASVAAHATGAFNMAWPNLYTKIRLERQAAAQGGPPATTRAVHASRELPQWRLARWLATEWWPGPPPGIRREPLPSP